MQMAARRKPAPIYERQKGQELIDEYLSKKSNEDKCILCLIDMDDLRNINLQHGYRFGDLVLEVFTETLQKLAGKGDILVRFGSDEFLWFATKTDVDKVQKTLEELYSELKQISAKLEVEISCSIGAATTDDAEDYIQLYQLADSTLEHIKHYGKNDLAWYVNVPDEMEGFMLNGDSDEADIEKIVKDSFNFYDDIISFAFDVFDRVDDMDRAYDIIITRVGQQFGLDTVKLIRMPDHQMIPQIFRDWYSSPDMKAADIIEKDYTPGKDFLEGYFALFNSEGYFVDNEINLNNVDDIARNLFKNLYKKHFFVNGIFDAGIYRGAVIFESDKEDYAFEGENLNTLKKVAKILSTNILKQMASSASQAKSIFLSKMSHDIRTPMNGIIGMTNIAISSVDDKEKVLECLGKIDVSAKYLLNLINDILDISKIESGKLSLNEESTSLHDLLEDVHKLSTVQADAKHINFELNVNICDNFVKADHTKINQVLTNLVGNAIKFTPDYGTVKLNARQTMQEADIIKVQFEVEDNGIGIDNKNLSRIFNAFEQADDTIVNNYGGSGLGLTISSNLISLMGGTLRVDTELGEGSRFYFELPFKIDDNPNEEEQQNLNGENEQDNTVDYTGKHVLLVEDNELNAEIATAILERIGLEVDLADNGKKAVMQFAQMSPFYYDLILMDIRMPVMDGLEATRYIRSMNKKDSKSIPIFALTANAFDDEMERCLKEGMNGHLAKPIEVNKLYATLNKQFANK